MELFEINNRHPTTPTHHIHTSSSHAKMRDDFEFFCAHEKRVSAAHFRSHTHTPPPHIHMSLYVAVLGGLLAVAILLAVAYAAGFYGVATLYAQYIQAPGASGPSEKDVAGEFMRWIQAQLCDISFWAILLFVVTLVLAGYGLWKNRA